MAEYIREAVEAGIARIVLDRADLHNAFNDEMIRELTDAFAQIAARCDVRVVVLRGEGRSFCAGADVNWMKRMVGYSFDENVADAMALSSMLKSIYDCPVPVIARVHGTALGGGVGLIAACDMAVAVESATFGLTEARLGILPAVISPFVLRKIGPGHARRYFVTAERFSADEARRIGLISEVVATADDLDRRIAERTSEILKNGPEAVRAAKRIIDEVMPIDWPCVQALTAERIAERRVSAEGQEGLKSFLEKRAASWLAKDGG
ncbi:MAG: enoyl-CoA hydratase/isomerase family protein [Phycisphaerae bacterium]|nr:enoyl-CoA hydratase/isomerase family protein [Phycisphaerae bacterium]